MPRLGRIVWESLLFRPPSHWAQTTPNRLNRREQSGLRRVANSRVGPPELRMGLGQLLVLEETQRLLMALRKHNRPSAPERVELLGGQLAAPGPASPAFGALGNRNREQREYDGADQSGSHTHSSSRCYAGTLPDPTHRPKSIRTSPCLGNSMFLSTRVSSL